MIGHSVEPRVTSLMTNTRYDRRVSEMSPPPFFAPGPPPRTPAPKRFRPSLALLFVALLVTLGVAIVGWFRPVPPAAPEPQPYSAEQIAKAKAKVCSTYEQVRKAVVTNTSRSAGEDPTATLAVAANARAALYNGGDYLSKALVQEPAAPPELIKAVRTLVDSYQKLALDYLSDAPESEQQSSRDAVSSAGTRVYSLCQ